MTSVDAAFYDGRSSARRAVRIEFCETGIINIRGAGLELRLNRAQVRVSPRLANTPRYLYLPDGARCEIADNDVVDTVMDHLDGGTSNRFLHFLESHYPTAIAALVITVGIVYAAIEYGIPELSRRVASSMPQHIETSLGREGLRTLDRGMFSPSNLDESTRRRVRRLFDSLKQAGPAAIEAQLELRSGERLGANAFALPAGYVVITDELIELAQTDGELLAVMAHEIGHVHNRHILRQILQNSLTALLVAGLFGDLTSIAGLSATLPTFLVQQKYSRQFEQEADEYAAEVLRARNVPVTHLTNILKRLAVEQAGTRGKILDYLSSHPATDKRIETLLEEQSEKASRS